MLLKPDVKVGLKRKCFLFLIKSVLMVCIERFCIKLNRVKFLFVAKSLNRKKLFYSDIKFGVLVFVIFESCRP